MQTQTLGIHQKTFDAVFQHPISRNLQWHDVRSMLTAFADAVQEEHNGNVKFTKNGQTLVVHPPRRKDFSDVQELMHIRHFLEKSAEATATTAPVANEAKHLLVVIDHREARIFKSDMPGSMPERIAPVDPTDSHRHLHSVTDDSNGQLKPELKPFYDAITKKLAGAEQILIFGSATGSSSAMQHLVSELKANHPQIAAVISGTVTIDDKHTTDDQLLAQARAFYAKAPKLGST